MTQRNRLEKAPVNVGGAELGFGSCSQFVVYQFCRRGRVIVSSRGIISRAKHIRDEVLLSYVLPVPGASWENNYSVGVTND